MLAASATFCGQRGRTALPARIRAPRTCLHYSAGLTVYSDLFAYRELFGNLFRRDLQAKYKGSALGVVWVLLPPLVLMGVYLLVFHVLWRAANVPHYSLYLLAGSNLTIDKDLMRQYLEEALPIFVDNDDKSGYALLFDGFATLEWANGNVTLALQLAGYAAATERSAGTGLASLNREFAGFYPETLVGDPANAAAFAEGQHLDLEQATALALHRS